MKVLEKRSYLGPNLYANFRVNRLTLDIEQLEEYPSAEIPGFVDALLVALPSLAEHGCSYREAGCYSTHAGDVKAPLIKPVFTLRSGFGLRGPSTNGTAEAFVT